MLPERNREGAMRMRFVTLSAVISGRVKAILGSCGV